MLLIENKIESDGTGSVKLLPEEPEDMASSFPSPQSTSHLIHAQWHAYNLIAVGDTLTAPTIRRIVKAKDATEPDLASTKSSSERVHMILTIHVTAIDFDPQAGQLHIRGQVCAENKFVALGTYHTIDLEIQRKFTLRKDGGWDSVAVQVVKDAVRKDKEGAVPAVVMHEGLANICLITENRTLLKQRVEMSVPKKRAGKAGDHDTGLAKFYKLTLETLLRHFDITQPRPLLIASPGFVAAGFQKHIIDEATKTGNKALLGNKKNFLVVHSSSGHLHSLNEVLRSQEVLSKLRDTAYAKETQYMDEFMTMLRMDDGRAWYGPTEVERAVEKGAVGRGGGVLLINNSLFRSQDVQTRRRWVGLVDRVREDGGEARILSSDHESGKRLEGLGGIAAVLTYPLHDLDEEGSEDGDDGGGVETGNGNSNVGDEMII